ncbi:MAG: ATP-binding protein, partial [candidate division Zixibacteria bacterium]|nr:ATP-binding protein [candidate division Zixibacteria bacterium]
MSSIILKYSSVLDSENIMYDDVRSFLVKQNIHRRLINNIMLSISEAFTNALLHGNQLDPNKSIQILITTNNKVITADITDEGTGEVDKLGDSKVADPWQEGGRGMMLIKRMTSDIKFRKSSETGGICVS